MVRTAGSSSSGGGGGGVFRVDGFAGTDPVLARRWQHSQQRVSVGRPGRGQADRRAGWHAQKFGGVLTGEEGATRPTISSTYQLRCWPRFSASARRWCARKCQSMCAVFLRRPSSSIRKRRPHCEHGGPSSSCSCAIKCGRKLWVCVRGSASVSSPPEVGIYRERERGIASQELTSSTKPARTR